MIDADAVRLEDTSFDATEFRRLWLVAVATYGVGDVVTTSAVIWFVGRLTEANALVSLAVDLYGQAGLIGLKLAAFAVCIAVSVYGARVDDRFLFYLPPATLAVAGAVATAYNLSLFVR
jgi:hypothetical protein